MGKSKSNSAPKAIKTTRRSVSIQEASNGFVISTYTDRGEKIIIAKTKKEAKKAADKLLGM